MNFRTWYTKRGTKFILQRGKTILERQGLTADKAIRRVEQCVDTLYRLDCAPTLPTPGDIVQRYPEFILSLQQKGVEIAVHSFHHKNLSELPITLAKQQLERAVRTFELFGLEAHGFRCPYLGFTDELIESLPSGLFKYSSNDPIYWEPSYRQSDGHYFYETLKKFYYRKSATETACMPQMKLNLIEIPVCVPDDLQLFDGLSLNPDGLFQEWKLVQDAIYGRGELFNLLFHPELATFCNNPFISLLNYVRDARPAVWVTRLRDISDWWFEKSQFKVDIIENEKVLTLDFTCSSRATILIRGVNFQVGSELWDGNYSRFHGSHITIPASLRPFIGLANDTPKTVVSFLIEQGYIVDLSEKAIKCSIFLDDATVAQFPSTLKLVEFIESSTSPLIRYWRWPDGAKSALSITGDLDVLSLIDYAARIFY